MPLDELIQRLAKAPTGQRSFLSVYLNLRPDGSGKKLHTVFLKGRLPEISKTFPPHSREQALLAGDLKRVQKYLEDDLHPSWKGIAFFACASERLFLSIPMPLPPENAVALAPYPHLFSLIRQGDLYQTYVVVVANPREARLFLVSDGRPEKQTSLSWKDERTARPERMGWSLPKFQRHIQEHVKLRAKETVENLGKILQRKKADYLFLVAEEGMEGELKKQLPAPLRKNLIPLASLDSHDPDHKVLSGAFETLRRISAEKAEALARQIIEEAQPLGQATTGPEPTLSALQNHQIERMVFDARFRATGWGCWHCGSLGMGGLPGVCPLCRGEVRSTELREEMAFLAKSRGAEVSFVENFAPLMKAGGVGALLKFKVSAKTKK